MHAPSLIAVILCGGQSSRMGQDKGLIKDKGVAWAKILAQKLADLSVPVYISVNHAQQAAYTAVFSTDTLIIDDKTLVHINGPLRGILSAFRAHPQQHLLFVPCDMPLLSQPVFTLWMDTFSQYCPPCPVLVSHTPDGLQPLCGIYSAVALQTLNHLYQQGQLRDQSMHTIVEHMLHAYLIEIPQALTGQFANFNTPDDLAH